MVALNTSANYSLWASGADWVRVTPKPEEGFREFALPEWARRKSSAVWPSKIEGKDV
ncbi:hypothetical protein SBA2_450062 [Acidobacteriia bacterium SbA2]|nr:hypothetical protein SBA2_450062 [Acidobacteriia bacterium SbA2]